MNTLNIAYDPGFGNGKAAVVQEGILRTAVVPSVVGVGSLETGLLGIGGMGKRRRAKRPFVVAFDGMDYLCGPNVRDYCQRPAQRLDFDRLSNGPELRALFYTAMFSLLGGGDHSIALIVGLPVEVMEDRSLAQRTRRALRRWMVGQHQFTVRNKSVNIRIEKVDVMAQPAGAWFSWGLNDDGVWVRGEEALSVETAVADVGFNTLDLFTIRGSQVIRASTGGDTVGMRRASEIVAHAVEESYGVALTLHEADALVNSRSPTLSIADGDIDAQPIVNQALDSAAANIVTFIEGLWGNARRFRYVLFCGGGLAITHIRRAVTRQIDHAIILPDPVLANAIGLARFAHRQAMRELNARKAK